LNTFNKWFGSRSDRELFLLAATTFVTLTLIVALGLVRPTYRHWRDEREHLNAVITKYVKLAHNLTQNDLIKDATAELESAPVQKDSDQITLSEYLRNLEAEGTRQKVELVSMRPDPTEQRNGYKLYRVHVVAAGRLPEVLRFVESASRGRDGLSAGEIAEFAVRSVASGEAVECSIYLVSIRLTPEGVAGRSSKSREKNN
jgi:hypothetical protein